MEKGKLSKYLHGRPALNDDQFARLFAADKVEIALRLRNILQKWADIDIAGMIPSDELYRDVGLGQLDCLDVFCFYKDINSEFHIKVPDAEAQKMRTFNDVVEYIAKTSSQKL